MKKLKKKSYFSIHYSFIVLMLISVILGFTKLLIMYFLCLCIHEFVHGYVARKLGYKIGKIRLLATGAVLEAESDEFTFSDEILIALSGPLFNLCFAFLIIAFWWIVPESYNYTMDLCVINLSIFAFNMLPIFPLDGGRILLASLSKRVERKKAVNVSKLVTINFSLLLFLLFVISLFYTPNFSVGTMAITLFIGGIVEDKKAVYKRNFYLSRKQERANKRGVEVRYLYLSETVEKSQMLRLLNARFYTIFILIDNDFNKMKIVEEKDLLSW